MRGGRPAPVTIEQVGAMLRAAHAPRCGEQGLRTLAETINGLRTWRLILAVSIEDQDQNPDRARRQRAVKAIGAIRRPIAELIAREEQLLGVLPEAAQWAGRVRLKRLKKWLAAAPAIAPPPPPLPDPQNAELAEFLVLAEAYREACGKSAISGDSRAAQVIVEALAIAGYRRPSAGAIGQALLRHRQTRNPKPINHDKFRRRHLS
jgi:hypothetical protein